MNTGTGKWTAEQIGVAGLHNEVPVYDITGADHVCRVAGAENARLIAAAPEMHAELSDIATLFDTPAGLAVSETDPALMLRTVVDRARAVLAHLES